MDMFGPLLLFTLVNKKLLDWVRTLIPDELEAKVLIPISWAIGMVMAVAFHFSESMSKEIVVWGDLTLAKADLIAVLMYGFAVGASSGVLHDFLKPNNPGDKYVTAELVSLPEPKPRRRQVKKDTK